MHVSPALSNLLADRRNSLNERVARTRSRHPGLDTAALSAFLIDPIDPLLGRVLGVRPDGGPAFIEAAFDMALALVEHGRAGDGPRAAIVRRLWSNVAPPLAPIIAVNARDSLGALTNAAINLSAVPGVRLDDWIDRLASLADQVQSVAELRALAIVTAWRAGAAHLRDAALDAKLPPSLANRAVGAGQGADWSQLVEAFRAGRWWTPDRIAPSDGHRIGDFTGFGGRFTEPPALYSHDSGFILRSKDQHFLLDADAYGATLRPASIEAAAASEEATPAMMTADRRLQADDRTVACDWPADGLLMARTAESIAVVSPWSYAVQVFPRRLP